jgi:cysteine-rich repeat protein
MNKLAYFGSAALAVGAASVLVYCSSGPVCGNGVKESGELCDNGALNGTAGNGCSASCSLVNIPRASVQVQYTKLVDESPGFTGSSCPDLQIDHAHVVLDGPSPVSEDWPCASKPSFIYGNVMPGSYQATIQLFDKNNQPLTNPIMSTRADVAAPDRLDLTVNFHFKDLLKTDYVGTLYINPSWGTADATCTTAAPAVTMETVQLTKMDGSAVAGNSVTSTSNMMLHKLDGTPGACFTQMGNDIEKVANLPCGHYKIALTGRVAGGAVAYCKKFDDLFVGPGVATPTFQLLVPAADADAGSVCP